MSTVTISETIFELLRRKAQDSAQTPDQIADELLRKQLLPKHACVEIVEKATGSQAMIKGTRVPVSIIVGYLRIGETPESLVENTLPHLTLAQVYDALSYYHDHQDEIEQEMAENTKEYGRAYLRSHLGEDGYQRVTGQQPPLSPPQGGGRRYVGEMRHLPPFGGDQGGAHTRVRRKTCAPKR